MTGEINTERTNGGIGRYGATFWGGHGGWGEKEEEGGITIGGGCGGYWCICWVAIFCCDGNGGGGGSCIVQGLVSVYTINCLVRWWVICLNWFVV